MNPFQSMLLRYYAHPVLSRLIDINDREAAMMAAGDSVFDDLYAKLGRCTVVDDACAATTAAADKLGLQVRETYKEGNVEDIRQMALIFGSLRTVAARLWRLDNIHRHTSRVA